MGAFTYTLMYVKRKKLMELKELKPMTNYMPLTEEYAQTTYELCIFKVNSNEDGLKLRMHIKDLNNPTFDVKDDKLSAKDSNFFLTLIGDVIEPIIKEKFLQEISIDLVHDECEWHVQLEFYDN